MKKGPSKPKRLEMIWGMCLTVILILVGIVPSLAEDGETGLEVSGLQESMNWNLAAFISRLPSKNLMTWGLPLGTV